jgi:hypothetical protein
MGRGNEQKEKNNVLADGHISGDVSCHCSHLSFAGRDK